MRTGHAAVLEQLQQHRFALRLDRRAQRLLCLLGVQRVGDLHVHVLLGGPVLDLPAVDRPGHPQHVDRGRPSHDLQLADHAEQDRPREGAGANGRVARNRRWRLDMCTASRRSHSGPSGARRRPYDWAGDGLERVGAGPVRTQDRAARADRGGPARRGHGRAGAGRARRRLVRLPLVARHGGHRRRLPPAPHDRRPGDPRRPDRGRRGYALLRACDRGGVLRRRPPRRGAGGQALAEDDRLAREPPHRVRLREGRPSGRARPAGRPLQLRRDRPPGREPPAGRAGGPAVHRGRRHRGRCPAAGGDRPGPLDHRLRRLRRRQRVHHAHRPRAALGHRDRRPGRPPRTPRRSSPAPEPTA